ncbi:MAG: CDP-glucose 4,6-dehydratase [Bacillota bacterium]|nr:CDP-glucose 4,6-dehydratase [Bacillota bacterium]
MEGLAVMFNKDFYKNKRIFLTGHTGFKGSWLCMLLTKLGAEVYGYALEPNTDPNLYEVLGVNKYIHSTIGDIRDLDALTKAMAESKPDIAIHMAAQPLVRESYRIPVETYATNVMGTVHFLEAVRQVGVKASIVITTDKVYENDESGRLFNESDRYGGDDPYSNSKACCELVTHSYRKSFFPSDGESQIASARAGNVIGGGDFSENRLIPDCVRAVLDNQTIILRSPRAVRPWQHVLEPLTGYLTLAEALYKDGAKFASGWNFGPLPEGHVSTEEIVRLFCKSWGDNARYEVKDLGGPHEAGLLKLDIKKSIEQLNFQPHWDLNKTMETIADWTKAFKSGENMYDVTMKQINDYFE